ncbi:MAG: protein translocase subunit SecD [Clostridia bacterium]|nr:protein translocase subunit SecD [Clostridia bacterium]
MRKKSWFILLLTIILVCLLGALSVCGLNIQGKRVLSPVKDALSLGLDLRGGVYTVYYAENDGYSDEEFQRLLSDTASVLRNRLTNQGYTEANISLQGGSYIRVEIPDVSDPQEVLKIIGTPAHLTFTDPYGNVIIEGKDVSNVRVAGAPSESGVYEAMVNFELTKESAKVFSDATERLRGQYISINLDGEAISSPRVTERIPGGNVSITMGGAQGYENAMKEAENLATLIMSGALPLDIEESETRAISATLGEDAIDTALIAGIVGILLVFLFMIVMYRLPGLMADIALGVYIIIIFNFLAHFKIQLTLPGIAGILLGVGMAVDANIVIFERFREMVLLGSSYESAVKTGFKNALRAIADANITTLIAAFVLMFFGTGSIRGFSYTLALGVIVSLFTAVSLTRFLFKHAIRLGFTSRALYIREGRAQPKKTVSVVKHAKILHIVSLVIILSAVILNIFGLGLNIGIDFTGGSILEYAVGEDFSTEEVSGILTRAGFEDNNVSKVASRDGGEGELTNLQIRLPLADPVSGVQKAVRGIFSGMNLQEEAFQRLSLRYLIDNSMDTALSGGCMFTLSGDCEPDELKEKASGALEENAVSVSTVLAESAEDGSVRLIVVPFDPSAAVREALESEMRENYPGFTYISIEHAGAVASSDLIKNAVMSISIALVLMLIYIAIRFDLISGVAALWGLMHDILIMLSFMTFFSFLYPVNSPFIAALLTIVGYSINDTIIIFDRVRENKKLYHETNSNAEIADMSVSSTFSRTINTTITTLFTLAALFIFGVDSIRAFTFPLLVGMLAGTYSSLMLNGSVWARLSDKTDAHRKSKEAEKEENTEKEAEEGRTFVLNKETFEENMSLWEAEDEEEDSEADEESKKIESGN